MSKKYVYLFSEGNGSMRELLGGKGANLAEMTNLGMPVPHGFTVTTEACTRYYEDGKTIAPEIEAEIRDRDHRDSHRENAPLRQAEDAILLDSTSLTEEEVVLRIVEALSRKTGKQF